MGKQNIGILIGSKLYRKLQAGRKTKILTLYEEACKNYNLNPCFISFKDIIPNQPQIKAYIQNTNGDYQLAYIEKPLVIHNRGYQNSKSAQKRLKRLREEGMMIFNEWNCYGKLYIHQILMENQQLIPHLPETQIVNEEHLYDMINKYQELIVKPNKGTLGKRNKKLTKLNNRHWILTSLCGDSYKEEIITIQDLVSKLVKTKRNYYLIQERIKLATFQQNPFDIRVSVQRNEWGEWQVTGMVAKVAGAGNFVTNVARGGTCYSLNQILEDHPQLQYKQVYDEIKYLSLAIADQLSNRLPFLVDLGLDIGITAKGFPMFIECNARDLRYSFRNANLLDIWKETYKTPIGYGKYLLNQQI
ncbi:YheC/YheD family endospore coat-associated protein [Bacillus sp. JJ1764]|uniref:YheC/YheD family endospore coat-associated protein n=1 Tax=Bacillus sp. JJ1764 TaxID=3122964 RepID=UPI002FFEE48D